MALITPTQPLPSARFCENPYNEKNINLNEYYRKIYNIFSENAYKKIPEWSKKLPTFSDLNHIFRFPFSQMFDKVYFSADHKVENFGFIDKKSYPRDNDKIWRFVLILLQRFAEELNLVGEHKIRIVFLKQIFFRDGYYLQDWHYDSKAKTTMVAILQNDTQEEKSQLSIAQNNALRLFPSLYNNLFPPVPKDYITVECPENGAIIINQMKGLILHKCSQVTKPKSRRTVVQISLEDPDWT